MPEIEVRHLRILCTVADTGSLTRASAKLGISQPGLTTQVQRIERIVGTEVFLRNRSGVVQTAFGRRFIDAARAVLAGMDHLESMAHQANGTPTTSTLRLGGVQGRLISAWTGMVSDRYPELEVRAHIGLPSPTLVKQLGKGQLDAATVHEHPGFELTWPDGVRRSVLQPKEPAFVLLADTHPLADNKLLHLSELAEQNWIMPPPDEEQLPAVFQAACAHAGFTARVRHYVADPVARVHFVQAGQGITLCGAISRTTDGCVIRPLHGDPIWQRRLVAWRSHTEFGQVLYRCARAAYLELIGNNPTYQRWWNAHPGYRPDCPAQ
jgi:DNA-binding transcriptional LysR family regulator